MRNGILALLGCLAAGGVSLAQPAAPSQPAPGPARSWEALVTSAAASRPVAAPAANSWESLVSTAAGPPAVPPPPPAPAPEPPPAGPDRFWFRADYLLWWTKDGPLPVPLLTTGPASAAIIGGLSQQGTQVLFGGGDQDYDSANGLRLDLGAWLDDDRHWGLGARYFALERHSVGSAAASNANGSPVLAQPLIDAATGQEFTELIALPGFLAGTTAISTSSRLQGWEINAFTDLCRGDRLNADLLFGFRGLSLDEDLQMSSDITPLVSSFLTFRGQFVNPPSSVVTYDAFRAQTHFYGPQVGGRVDWTAGRLSFGADARVAFGDSQELVRVVGTSSLITPGAATVTVPGGVLALSSNIGRYFREQFAVVPEVGLRVGCQISPSLGVSFGYSFLYWTDVVRPGILVDRTVAPGLVPTDRAFGTATGTRPAFQFHSSDYWAQGLNFGLDWRF
jgi:hypothetical protein